LSVVVIGMVTVDSIAFRLDQTPFPIYGFMLGLCDIWGQGHTIACH